MGKTIVNVLEDLVNMVIQHDSSTPDNDQDFQDKFQGIENELLELLEQAAPEKKITKSYNKYHYETEADEAHNQAIDDYLANIRETLKGK